MSEPSSTPFGLRWGIKRSFLAYVQRMPDGQGSLGDGARSAGSQEVLFPPVSVEHGSADDGAATTTWTFRGEVRFSGHLGMLSVRVAAPVLTVRGAAAELSVAAPSGDDGSDRLPLVTLQLERRPAPDGIESWSGTDVRLAEAAIGLFNDVYPAGEPFDSLTVMLPVVTRRT